MGQAEQAGAQFIPGVRVDALVREGNKVTGVQAGDDILEANVVILADGVNSMLGRSLEWFPLPIRIITLLVLKVIGLTPERINNRFNITGEEGAAWLFAGSPSDGLMGGDFSIPTRIPYPWGWFVDWVISPIRKKACRKCWKILNNTPPFAH